MIIKTTTCFVLLLLLSCISACQRPPSPFYEESTSKPFMDVLQDVEFIITEKNFRITNRLHIGEAIQDRGTEGFPQNEVILFCNLTLAEDMLRLAPEYINYCPYKIAVASVNNEIIISTHLLPEKTGKPELDSIAKKINTILRQMIEYAASEDPFILDKNN